MSERQPERTGKTMRDVSKGARGSKEVRERWRLVENTVNKGLNEKSVEVKERAN